MRDDSVPCPHLGWWIAIGSGLTLLAVLAGCEAAYQWWIERVFWLPPRVVLIVTWWAAVAAHVLEARFAYKVALRTGRRDTAWRWALQTFLIGFPSLRLLLRAAG
ncbi:MAG: DUF4499 domain-containing protein [Nannocystaceae bacterium]